MCQVMTFEIFFFCVRRGPSQVGPRQFERVLDMVSKVRALGMEVDASSNVL